MKLTFGKNEKLKSKKAIEALFTSGNTYVSHPIRVVYKIQPKEEAKDPIKVAVSVSKKKFKHAVDRNLLKRRMREAYRLNKTLLKVDDDSRIDLLFIYTSSRSQSYELIEQAMQTLLKKFEVSPVTEIKEGND